MLEGEASYDIGANTVTFSQTAAAFIVDVIAETRLGAETGTVNMPCRLRLIVFDVYYYF